MKIKRACKKLLAPSRSSHEGDRRLLICAAALLFCGLIGLSSATAVVAYAEKGGNAYYFLQKQLFGVFLGLIAFIFLAKIDYHLWRRYAFSFLVFSVALLLLVFIPGLAAEHGTARSWIYVFGFSLQPSEFVKLSFLFYLAAWLEARQGDLHRFELGLGPFLAVLGLIGLLMMLQPDFGTLFIIALSSLAVFFTAGGSYKHIFLMFLAAAAAFLIMVQIMPYQMDRIRCVLDPEFSPDKKCYQVNQALIAVGSGGLWGRGLGESRQKYMYIPEVSSDSVFAVIAEEIGFFASLALIAGFFYLFWRGYRIARNAPDDFGRFLAIGIVSWITIQAFVNIGGIINLIPMTGVPLPLVSAGGSSVLAVLAAIGVLFNISKQTRR